jgi:predicted phosphodiesterase
MTRIVILADIHGNLPALDAVLPDIERLAPDQVIVNGDVVNRGPQSKECLAAIRATGWPVVFGNHEEYVLKFAADDVPDEWRADFWLPFHRVVEELDDEEIAYIKALPWHYVVDAPGLPAIRIVHGSTRRLNEGLGFWLTDEELLEAIRDAPEPVVVGAHAHRPFDHRIGERWVLNCGAIGAPYNGNPAAQYLVLTAQDGAWQADFRVVPYDRTPVYEAWERTGYMQRCMVAQVFKYELETATFHLMSYFDFCKVRGLERNDLASFRRYRDATADVPPGRSLRLKPGR